MQILQVILIALGLSADCFAVALAASCTNKNLTRFQVARVSFSFGIFQALMPLIGWAIGRTLFDIIANFDHWVAFAMLAFVGGKMLWESFHTEKEDEKKVDVSKGLMLLTLSVATSLDALAVGLALAFEDINIWLAAGIIGVTAITISGIGFLIGRKVSGLLGKRAETVGGLVLIGIGIRILLTHLL
jgi:manganese efflux pump family protein